MNALIWVGLVVLILGIASLVVLIHYTDRESLVVAYRSAFKPIIRKTCGPL